MTLHYTHRELYALAHYIRPLALGYMRVRLLKHDRISITWGDDEAYWLRECFMNDTLPMDPFQFVVVSETVDRLQRKYDFD